MNRFCKTCALAVAAMLLFFIWQPVSHASVPGTNGVGRDVTVRVMTYNIHAGKGSDGQYDLSRIAGVIRDSGADIVGLQEVDVHWGSRSHYQSIIKRLADVLDMYYFFAPIYNLDPPQPGKPRRQYGVAVLSQYPIIHAANHNITRLSTQDENPSPKPAPGFAEAVIDVNGAKVSFYVTHLDYRGDPTVREMQVRDMMNIFSQNDRSQKILVGDMNAGPSAPELAPLFTNFQDAWSVTHDSPGYTYSAKNPVKRIDDIFVSPGIKVQSAHVIRTLASDHLPVTADVTLVRGP